MKHLFTRAPAVFTGAAALLAGGLLAAPASAQGEAESMMSLGGYTNYTVSFTKFPGGDGDPDTYGIQEQEGDIQIFNNTEIFFTGSAETDGGLQVSGRVELEGHTTGDQIDEHFITVSGGFGSFEVGANDGADYRMAQGLFFNSTAVDYYDWNEVTVPTANGRGPAIGNDGMGLVYTTPSLGGASFAIGYKPSLEADEVGFSQHGDSDVFTFGAKYEGDMDGITFAGSFGYGTHEIAAVAAKDPVYTQSGVMVTTASDGTLTAVLGSGDIEIGTARVVGAPKKSFTAWGVGVNLGFGDTTLYARYDDQETDPDGAAKPDELTSAALAIVHVIGPVKLGLGWSQGTKTAPNTGLRMVDPANDNLPLPAYTGTGTVPTGMERASAGEQENEDTMVIGSVDYSLGSGVTLSGYVAWGETEQTGAVHDIDDTNTTADDEGATAATSDGLTGPEKNKAASDSGTAFGVALNLAF